MTRRNFFAALLSLPQLPRIPSLPPLGMENAPAVVWLRFNEDKVSDISAWANQFGIPEVRVQYGKRCSDMELDEFFDRMGLFRRRRRY